MTETEPPDDPPDEIRPQPPPPPPPRPPQPPTTSPGPWEGHPHFRDPRPKVPKFPFADDVRDRLLFLVIDRLMWGHTVPTIIDQIQEITGRRLNRNLVYRLARYAWITGQLVSFPPRHHVLAREMAAHSNLGDIQVVPDRGGLVSSPVAEAGAQMVHDLIQDLASKRPGPVHIGFGIGQSTRRLAEILARMVYADRKSPPLVVHSLTTGHSVWDPTETPISFFGYFARNGFPDTEFVGLFAEPLVPVENYESALRSKIVQQAFERRDEIDIIISSLASAEDVHGHLYQYLARFVDPEAPERLLERGWVGDLMLRPYDAKGPMEITEGMKPITLFEIEDLVTLAHQPDKHVVLLCSPCGKCGRLKTDALAPMLTSPALHIWNHLLVDEATAGAVCGGIAGRPSS